MVNGENVRKILCDFNETTQFSSHHKYIPIIHANSVASIQLMRVHVYCICKLKSEEISFINFLEVDALVESKSFQILKLVYILNFVVRPKSPTIVKSLISHYSEIKLTI